MEAVLRNELEVQKLATLFVVPAALTIEDQEQNLWSAFKAGSRDALNSIFVKYSRLLYSYGRNMTPDQALIADCIQDIFVELWVRKEKISEVNSIRFYLMRALRRSVLKRLSADKRLLSKGAPDGNDDGDVEFSIEFNLIHDQLSAELRAQLQSAMTQLSKRQQEAIYLKFYENMSYEELSSVMDINVKAAYNLIGKAIIILRSVVKRSAA